jgi:acid phosphatase type 7
VRPIWLFLPLVSCAAWACGSSKNGAAGPDAGAGDAEADGGVPCDVTGVSKGPWVLHVDGTSAYVRWEACRAGTPAGVTYAPESGGTTKSATATETPFTVTKTIKVFNADAPPDYAGTWYMHEAQLTGLTPSTCYSYGLQADATIKARFCTARNPGDTVKFAAIGDTNPSVGYSTRDVVSKIVPQGFDFTLHGGDIEYYDSFVETYAYWFELMPPLLREGAFLPAIGNHDSDDQTGEPDDKYQQYTQRFWGNAGFDGQDVNYEYYAYSSGGVWFLTVDTEEPITQGSPQFQWVQSELAKAAASPGYRFSIYYQHRPMLTCGDTGDNTEALQQLQPLFAQYKVPLVIQAHMHGYERFEVPAQGTTPALTIITVGGGGGALGDINANTSRSYCNERVASGAFFHAALVEITPGQLSATVIDDQGNVRDSFQHAVP